MTNNTEPLTLKFRFPVVLGRKAAATDTGNIGSSRLAKGDADAGVQRKQYT